MNIQINSGWYEYPNRLHRLSTKSVGNTSESSALQTQYKSLIILFSAPKTYVMEFLVSDQVIDPTW